MNRTPPIEIRRVLRREIAFGCPAQDCGNPYLEWHHFDPPWRELQHHDPEGMVALCAEHHKKANAGAFTKEQLREMKTSGDSGRELIGRFDWLRQDLLAVVGGNFYHETLRVVEYQRTPVVWFNRDEDGHLLLNLRMLSTSNEERAVMEDNFWISRGTPTDLESPPSGKLLKIEYSNGDYLGVEYRVLASGDEANARYDGAKADRWPVDYPITAVEIHMRTGGSNVEFGPRWTKVGGLFMQNCFTSHCGTGLSFS